MMTTGTRIARFVRSLVLLAVAIVGVPWALTAAARSRFGGAAPLHGVPGPGDWEWAAIRGALTDQLTEQTVADIVIRACLVVAWVSVVVLLVTVVAELAHMARHDGLAMPDVRGLGVPQSVARVIASGLLVLLPSFASSGTAIALDGAMFYPEDRAAASSADVAPGPRNTWIDDLVAEPPVDAPTDSGASTTPGARPDATAPLPEVGPRSYVVRGGDSIYAIAERFAGNGARNDDVAAYAERLVEINLGRSMVDGQRFTNAAYIDVGWVLELPEVPADGADDRVAGPVAEDHTVQRGETLWSIADEELGEGERWPEIYELNEGRTFDDGRVLTDPDLIQPGWDLDLPSTGSTGADPATGDAPAAPSVEISHGGIEDGLDIDDDRAPLDTAVPPDTAGSSDAVGGDLDHDVGVAAPRPVNVWNHDVPAAAIDVPEDASAPPDAEASVNGPGPEATAATGGTEATGGIAATGGTAAVDPTSDEHRADGAGAVDPTSDEHRADGTELLTLGRAAMLSAGALTLLAVRRRHRLRTAPPRSRLPELPPEVVRTERSLRSIDPGDRFVRVDIAVRAAASVLVDAGLRVVAVQAADDGSLLLTTSGAASLVAPWEATGDPTTWSLPGTTPIELLADEARRVGAPCPALVQLGRTLDGSDVYVDLEALEAVEVGGPGDQADAVVTAVAATLAGSVLAEVSTLVGLGIDDAAFLGHRHHVPVRDVRQAFDRAAEAIGTTAAQRRSTFELRARVTGGETWEPAIVLAGSAAGTVTPPTNRTGLAVVSASPIHGPSSRLAPDGDAWVLRPLGLRLIPVGLRADQVTALADLLGSPHGDLVVEDGPLLDLAAHRPGVSDGDHTLAPVPDDLVADPVAARAPSAGAAAIERPPVLVRLLGPVSVQSADGVEIEFERSKAAELVAWLATHRDRSTRAAARTALWELDVRDATFANVVSDARRSMARVVEPPEGDEWVGRTMTESLPLHPSVRTDADLVHEALEIARVQPPDQAIATLRPAVELIAGIPFEGTGYLWPDAEGLSSQLVMLCTTATSELAAHCLSVGDAEGVFAATGRGLRVLPGHEELIGLRMQAHARGGDQAGVRQEWEQYERVITADPWSDGEPSPRLVALRRDLLAR